MRKYPICCEPSRSDEQSASSFVHERFLAPHVLQSTSMSNFRMMYVRLPLEVNAESGGRVKCLFISRLLVRER
jgi:hypothetical protein